MAKLFWVALLFMGQPVFSQDSDVKELTRINQQWADLSMTKDTVAFAKIFADDFVLIAPNGAKRTKWEVVRNTVSQNIQSITIDSIDVKLLTNEVGLVTCYTSFVITDAGKAIKGKNCYQDVYIKRNKQWLAIAAHVTLLGMK